MTTPRLFTISRWIIGASLVLQGLAAAFYPGGTIRDPSARGYSLSANFISDLGMTVSHGGQANRVGAGLFGLGFGLFAIAVICCLVGFVRLHSVSVRGRQTARTGAIGAGVAGTCLLVAGLSPANIAPPLHMWSAAVATAIAPPSLVLLAIAAGCDARFPSGVSIAWLTLAAALAAWFTMRWGPAVSSQFGLTMQASVQKIVAAIVVGVVTYQTYRGSAVGEIVTRNAA